MNPKTKGEVAEATILSEVISRGFSASIPFGNNQRYDLILDDGKDLHRIQCKSGHLKNGCVIFYSCSTNGFTSKKRDYRGQIEFFLVYCPENKKIYKVPVEAAARRQTMLRIKPAKKNHISIRFAKKYEF